MRKMLTTAALLLALSCPTLAGEVHTPPAPQPQSVTVQEPTTNDTDETTDTDEDTGATDTLTEIVLTVLLSVLP